MAAIEELSSTLNTSVLHLEACHCLRMNDGNVVLVFADGNKLLCQLVPSPSSKVIPVPIQVNLVRGDVTMSGRKNKGCKADIVQRRNKNSGTSNKSRKRLKQELATAQMASRKAQSERDKAAHALKLAKAPAATKVEGHSPKTSVKTFEAPPPKKEAAQAASDSEVFQIVSEPEREQDSVSEDLCSCVDIFAIFSSTGTADRHSCLVMQSILRP